MSQVIDEITRALTSAITDIVSYLPRVIGAIVIIIIGYVIGLLAKSAVTVAISRFLGRLLERTRFGRSIKEAGIDYAGLIGGAIMALIFVASLTAAVGVLALPGDISVIVSSATRALFNIVAGITILIIGIPLAIMAAEWVSSLIFVTTGEKHEVASSLAFSIVSIVLVVLVLSVAFVVMFNYTLLLDYIVEAGPRFVGAGIILLTGYLLGHGIGKIVSVIVERVVAKPLEVSEIGRAIKESNIDLPGLIGGLAKGFVIVVAIVAAFSLLRIEGFAGELLSSIAFYLPRLIGGIAVLTLGLVLSVILAKYIGGFLKTVFKGKFEDLGSLAENLIMLGLIVSVVAIALNILELGGSLVYPLILGVVVIVTGVFIAEIIGKLIRESHPTYEKMVPFLESLIVLLFVIVGVSGIFSQFTEVSRVIAILSIGLSIAFALVLIPIAIYYARLSWKEASA